MLVQLPVPLLTFSAGKLWMAFLETLLNNKSHSAQTSKVLSKSRICFDIPEKIEAVLIALELSSLLTLNLVGNAVRRPVFSMITVAVLFYTHDL
jgi:hypothetical protein